MIYPHTQTAPDAHAGTPFEPVPQTMRALVKAAPEPGCELVEMPVPTPGPDDVLLKVAAGGICGTDLHIHRWDPWARSRVRPPRVIGHEFCGTVVSVGANVTEVALGDRVAGESHIACGWCPRCRHGEAHICERLEIIGKTWEQMTALLRRGLDIAPIITHRLPVEEFARAFELLESGGAGKVILTLEG